MTTSKVFYLGGVLPSGDAVTTTPGKHRCRRCQEEATYYSVRLGNDTTMFYFYCRKHKTPAAKPFTEQKGSK